MLWRFIDNFHHAFDDESNEWTMVIWWSLYSTKIIDQIFHIRTSVIFRSASYLLGRHMIGNPVTLFTHSPWMSAVLYDRDWNKFRRKEWTHELIRCVLNMTLNSFVIVPGMTVELRPCLRNKNCALERVDEAVWWKDPCRKRCGYFHSYMARTFERVSQSWGATRWQWRRNHIIILLFYNHYCLM